MYLSDLLCAPLSLINRIIRLIFINKIFQTAKFILNLVYFYFFLFRIISNECRHFFILLLFYLINNLL